MTFDAGVVYERYRGLIINEVKRFLWNGMDFDELMQIAYFAADAAVNSYDGEREGSFEGYFKRCLRRTLLREVNATSAIKISEHMSYKVRSYFAAKTKLRRVLSREPRYEELATELKCSIDDVKRIEANDIRMDVSLEGFIRENGDKNGLLAVYEGGFGEVESEQFWEMVKECVGGELYSVVDLVYRRDLSCREAARKLGLSYGGLNRRLNMAVLKLKRDTRFKKIYGLD